ncbi:4431_t:CDS:2 [Acaulospora morrowiae]|uniref:4431_t:CDS:1 n=1 Tax=Acaulospora morrowiae TaxID=94023 RepID=A0A9N8ZFA0_9GLOM|nr:4431_t:CDS:2 [Acaulospora morrowiae]
MADKPNPFLDEANKNPPPSYEPRGAIHGNGNSEKYKALTGEEADATAAASVNPGIETSDPSKLVYSGSGVLINKKPSQKRLVFRFCTFLTSFGALMCMAGAPLYSKKSSPPNGANGAAIVFTYIDANKVSRWILHGIDSVLAVSYGCLMVYLIKGFSCKPGTEDGWCDFYNFSIFFTVLSFLLYVVSFFWDIAGTFKIVKK